MRLKPGLPARLNNLWIFHPNRWPHTELIGRSMALIAVSMFLFMKFQQFGKFPQLFEYARRFYGGLTAFNGEEMEVALIWGVKLMVWLAETGILVGYLGAYLSRIDPVGVADGFMETVFPICMAGIPVLIAMAPAHHFSGLSYSSTAYLPTYLGVMALMAIGAWINLAGLLTLRRSFSIMTEARELVRRGIFRCVRHPLYSGHFMMFFAALLLRWHWYTVVLYVFFCIGQVIRAKMEERKLEQAFSDYADYRRRTGMFIPRLIRRD